MLSVGGGIGVGGAVDGTFGFGRCLAERSGLPIPRCIPGSRSRTTTSTGQHGECEGRQCFREHYHTVTEHNFNYVQYSSSSAVNGHRLATADQALSGTTNVHSLSVSQTWNILIICACLSLYAVIPTFGSTGSDSHTALVAPASLPSLFLLARSSSTPCSSCFLHEHLVYVPSHLPRHSRWFGAVQS